jgi:hypothetical protein
MHSRFARAGHYPCVNNRKCDRDSKGNRIDDVKVGGWHKWVPQESWWELPTEDSEELAEQLSKENKEESEALCKSG